MDNENEDYPIPEQSQESKDEYRVTDVLMECGERYGLDVELEWLYHNSHDFRWWLHAVGTPVRWDDPDQYGDPADRHNATQAGMKALSEQTTDPGIRVEDGKILVDDREYWLTLEEDPD